MQKTIIAIGALIVIVIALWLLGIGSSSPVSDSLAGQGVLYSCNEGKTITASYVEGESTPSANPDMPPTPGGSVKLSLSDGRSMTLPQTISASGVRYANPDESFVFWTKGSGALVLENNAEKSFIDCIAVAPLLEGSNLTQYYSNSSVGFSIRLPGDIMPFSIDHSYEYQMNPKTSIAGVKFTIPQMLSDKTNLSNNTYLSVESIPEAKSCTADIFLDGKHAAKEITEGDYTYSFAESSDAGAGNRYEETVYAIPGTNPCVAVRYFVHYGVFENYEPGTVLEFDKSALLSLFDSIRHTLVIVQ